jgi:hypothetical protein
MDFACPKNYTSMSQLNVSRIMKLGDPAAQCDIQCVGSDGKLDDVGILSLVRDPVTPMTFTHTLERSNTRLLLRHCPRAVARQL